MKFDRYDTDKLAMATSDERDSLLKSSEIESTLMRKTFIICATVSIIACQLSFIGGAAQGYSAILAPQLMEDGSTRDAIDINKDEASWIASLGTICRPLGAIIEGFTVDRFGRKTTMVIVAIILAISWVLMAASQNIVMIYISRIMISIGLGMVICVGLYIAEISLPKQRGSLLSMITPITMLGTLAVYLLGSILAWRTVALIFAGHCCLTILLALCLVPESHIWYLLSSDRRDDAVYSLLRLRNGDISQASLEIAEAEVRFIDRKQSSSGGIIDFIRREFASDPAVWKPFAILTLFSVIQQQAGYTVIIYYAVDFFTSFDSPLDGYLLSIAFAAISTVGSITLTFVVHMYNRKTLLAVSGVGMCLTMSAAALFVTCDSLKGYKLAPVISVFCYIFCCMLGMIDIPWMIIGELFPSRVRGSMSAAVTVVIFFITTGVVKMYPPVTEYLGVAGTLWYFAVFSLLAVIYSAVFFPETKDKSLFEIEDNLRNEPNL